MRRRNFLGAAIVGAALTGGAVAAQTESALDELITATSVEFSGTVLVARGQEVLFRRDLGWLIAPLEFLAT